MSSIVVVGHRNPDNDSIASAVAYAYLKNHIEMDNEYVPARLGPLPDETVWVFERYGIAVPALLTHLFPRVADVMSSPVVSLETTATMLEAGRLMSARDLRALAVIHPDGTYAGFITTRTLAALYIEDIELVDACRGGVRVSNLVSSVDGVLVTGQADASVEGRLRVAASEHDAFLSMVEPGDTVVVGDRQNTQRLAIEAGVSCLVLTCGARLGDDICAQAQEKGVVIILTEHDTFTATRLLTLAQTLDAYLETDIPRLRPEMLLKEATASILDSSHREGVVLDDADHCVGIVTRSDIASAHRRKVILVDHNEVAQAAPGITETEVVEIVDHHRVGDIQTTAPIPFLNIPIGSTATIVAQQFLAHQVEIPADMAAALLSAVMTDTVLLKSPTATVDDEHIAVMLAEILGTDPISFGLELFKRRGDEKTLPVETLVGADAKEFAFGDGKILIAQHETTNRVDVLEREAEIVSHLDSLVDAKGYMFVLLLVTDVIEGGSQFIAAGDIRLVERAFDIDLQAGGVWVDGILSRKKQVAARLLEQGDR
jgi:manganese-dependent inorganic pyrophosphatase